MNEDIQIFTETVRYDEDQQHIFIKPLCDLFGIDTENQVRNIERDPILKNMYVTKADSFIFGDNRERVALKKVGFLRWVQFINVTLVRPELQQKLLEYQTYIPEWIMGKVDVETAVSKAYKRKDELKLIIKESNAELRTLEKFITSYLISKTYQTALPFDIKSLK
jgi:P22_AR N-terminal domain